MKFKICAEEETWVDLDSETVTKLILLEKNMWRRHTEFGGGYYGAKFSGDIYHGKDGCLIGPYKDPQQCADAVIRDCIDAKKSE